MSREIGGRADKDGNEFERLWLVSQSLLILQGKAALLYWERPGEVGYGIELELGYPDGRREVHQSKLENRDKGKWIASDLNAEGVLQAAQQQLQRPGISEFVFVSRDPAPLLRDLTERSHRTNNDPELFVQTALSSEGHRREFENLCRYWEFDKERPEDLAQVYALLQRMRFETGIWDHSERRRLEFTVSLVAEGEGRETISSLADFLQKNLGNDIYTDHIGNHLHDSGHTPRDFRNDPGVSDGIERLQKSFEESLTGMLLGEDLLPRMETAELLRLLDDPAGPRIVFLHGPAGIGKSDVQLELVRKLTERGTPFLPVRLDSHRPSASVSAYSREVLELPNGPAQCLAALASRRMAVLFIDQLDALRWTGGHSAEALRICKEIVEDAVVVETVRVVLACRTFDLDNDPNFKAWEKQLTERTRLAQRLEVGLLGEDQVESFVAEQGGSYAGLATKQRDLLRHPHTLFLWWSLFRDRQESPQFLTKTDLLLEYRQHLSYKLAEMGEIDALALLDEIVAYLDREGRLDAPVSLTSSRPRSREALQSLNVLRAARRSTITFTHQSLLDFLIAERVFKEALAGESSPVQWLRDHDQSLFRRDQLRQLLILLRDQDPDRYLTTLKEILQGQGIHFHLQHLALGMLREVNGSGSLEAGLVVELLASEQWRPHVLSQVIAGSKVWFEELDERKILTQWLESGDERLAEDALLVCRSAAAETPDRIERLLSPYWELGDEQWRERIDGCLGYRLGQLTDKTFSWRVSRVREALHRMEWHGLEDLINHHSVRALVLLEAHLLRMVDDLSGDLDPDLDSLEHVLRPLEGVCRSEPEEAWTRILPVLVRSNLRYRSLSQPPKYEAELWSEIEWPLRGVRKLNYEMRRLLAAAGGELAQREGLAVLGRVASLLSVRSKAIQTVVLFTLLGGPDEISDFAIQWLYKEPRRLLLGSTGSRFKFARLLLKRFSGICGQPIYEELESTLLKFHAPWEVGGSRSERYMPSNRGVQIWGYGRPQYLLLSAMPHERMSVSARERLDGWIKKFGEPAEISRGRPEGGAVGSPIPRDKLRLISDRQWLSIASSDWRRRGRSLRQVKPGLLAEASHEQFARDFAEMARLEPERFARLTLAMPSTSSRDYFVALLGAFAEGRPTDPDGVATDWYPASVELIEEVLRHIEGHLQDKVIAMAICWVIEACTGEAWSQWTVDLVRSYANHPDPQVGYYPVRGSQGGEELGDVNTSSINCVRGTAAGALSSLLFSNLELVETCLSTVRQLVDDPHPAVRVAAQGLCFPIYNYNRSLATDLFLQSCSHHDDRVLSGLHTSRFLMHIWDEFPEKLLPLLERMVRSEEEKAAQKGAFWVTVAHIDRGIYSELASMCRHGNMAQKKGVVEAMKQMFGRVEWHAGALKGLLAFLTDPEEDISIQVLSLLRDEEVLKMPGGLAIAEAFVCSSGFKQRSDDFFYRLTQYADSLIPLAPILRQAIEIVVSAEGRSSGAIFLPPVLLRLYEQAEGTHLRDVRNMCLDAWDLLLRRQASGGKVLSTLDA